MKINHKVDPLLPVGFPVLVSDMRGGPRIASFSSFVNLITLTEQDIKNNHNYYKEMGLGIGDSTCSYLYVNNLTEIFNLDTKEVLDNKKDVRKTQVRLESCIFLTKENFSLIIDNLSIILNNTKNSVFEYDKVLKEIQKNKQNSDSII